jgi:hypothetical protein
MLGVVLQLLRLASDVCGERGFHLLQPGRDLADVRQLLVVDAARAVGVQQAHQRVHFLLGHRGP